MKKIIAIHYSLNFKRIFKNFENMSHFGSPLSSQEIGSKSGLWHQLRKCYYEFTFLVDFKLFLWKKVNLKKFQMNSSWLHQHPKSKAIGFPSWHQKHNIVTQNITTSQIWEDLMDLLYYFCNLYQIIHSFWTLARRKKLGLAVAYFLLYYYIVNLKK